MNLFWDPITIVNLVLCIIILVLGIIGYRRSGKTLPLYIGIAFGLFGLSHLLTILGFKDALSGLLIVVRTAAYLLVAFAVYREAFGAKA
jgi:uncharacterized membrane protein (UPF0136 family)